MPRLVRALLVSLAATGIAAVLLSLLSRKKPGPVLPFAEGPDPEHMSAAQQQALLDELGAQL